MASPDIPDAPDPGLNLAPKELSKSLDFGRQRRIRGATLLAGNRTQNPGTLGSSILGGTQGGFGSLG
jgi:hypothetical protein